jgi:FtsH-binding integral membrane protein
MNKAQRIFFALVITFVFPASYLLSLGLEALPGGNVYLTNMLPFSIMIVGVYFLSFKIWDKAEQEAAEDGRPRTGRIVNKSQRILLALVITFVSPVNFILAEGLDVLTGDYIGEWMLIPTSIIFAVGVYFLSFKIWDKTEQEVQED